MSRRGNSGMQTRDSALHGNEMKYTDTQYMRFRVIGDSSGF